MLNLDAGTIAKINSPSVSTLYLYEIYYSDTEDPLRYTNWDEEVVYGGSVWTPFAIKHNHISTNSDGQVKPVTMTVGNIDEDRFIQQYIEQNFFRPSGMVSTRKMDYYSIIPGRVSGYRVVDGVPYNSTRILDEGFFADGDAELLSNLDDLTAWTRFLVGENAVSQESLELAWTPTYLDQGDTIDASYLIFYDERAGYGMGWFLSELDGRRIAWTPGAGRGFSTSITTLPDEGLSIVVLTNTRRFLVADRIARHLARVVLNYGE